MTTKPKVVDLFCGCGGLSIGFQRSGYEIVSAYDNWKPAVETYNANFSHLANLVELRADSVIPDSDVIIGGPPCQGFSSAGLRKFDDHRNTLVGVFGELIARYKPVAFIFENVEGFLTSQRGHFLFDLLEPVIDAGYRVHLRKINAANFGIPQHRKRVIAIGGLGWNPTFPEHTHSTFGAPGATLANGRHFPFAPTIAQSLNGLPKAAPRKDGEAKDSLNHIYSPFNDSDRERANLLKPGQRMHDLPEEMWHDSYRRRAYRRVMDGTTTERRGGAPSGLRRLCADEPSKTITGGALREFVHPTEDRPLTIRECARLQTFPDDFGFLGTQSEKAQMIGNAVPVELGEQIAKNLRKDLQSRDDARGEGALLSFIPTLSTGKSPILQEVCHEVQERFLDLHSTEQIELWP